MSRIISRVMSNLPSRPPRLAALMALMALVAWTLLADAQASPGAHGPNGEHLEAPAMPAAAGLARLPDGSVNVPKLAQRRIALRTAVAVRAEHPVTVTLNGRVAIDPDAGGRVQAPFAGRVEPGPHGLPLAGQAVRRGQVLARLRPLTGAVERGNQQAALADVQAMRALAERRLARLEGLEGTVPAKDIDAARAELASLAGRARALDGAARSLEPLVAPADGVIASATVLAGQIVDARDVLFEVIDPARLVVEALATDVTLAGHIGGATLPAAPSARLTMVGGARSLRDGAVPVMFRARGDALPLAVGQPVTVLARLRTTVAGIALPAAALVRSPANETVVWQKVGATRFVARPVEATALDAGTVVVTRGLAPDSRVVVGAAALVNQIR